MKLFNIVSTLIMLLCVSACNNGDIIDNEQSTPAPTRTLKLNAAMPGEATKSSGATTRLSLTETDEGTISVKWKEGDKINLCFVSGDGTVVRTVSNVPITNILDNGKKVCTLASGMNSSIGPATSIYLVIFICKSINCLFHFFLDCD